MRWSLGSILFVFGATVACGPVQSSTLIVDAAAELAAAQTAEAQDHAPFEYTAAEEYLHKAREEQSYAEYEIAVRYAQKSRDCARVARMHAESATRATVGSSRAISTTRARCRPGPEREVPLPDAQDEPNAAMDKPTGKPNGKPAVKPAAGPKKPISPREPADPPPEEPLPEGDPSDAADPENGAP